MKCISVHPVIFTTHSREYSGRCLLFELVKLFIISCRTSKLLVFVKTSGINQKYQMSNIMSDQATFREEREFYQSPGKDQSIVVRKIIKFYYFLCERQVEVYRGKWNVQSVRRAGWENTIKYLTYESPSPEVSWTIPSLKQHERLF